MENKLDGKQSAFDDWKHDNFTEIIKNFLEDNESINQLFNNWCYQTYEDR